MQKVGIVIFVGALCILSCDNICVAKTEPVSYGNIAKTESVLNGNIAELDSVFPGNAVFTGLEQYSNAVKTESEGNRNKTKADSVFSENAVEIKSEASKDTANVESESGEEAVNIKLEASGDTANVESEVNEDAINIKSETSGDTANVESEVNEDAANIKSEASGDTANVESEVNEDAANIKSEVNEDITNTKLDSSEDAANIKSEVSGDAANIKSEANKDAANIKLETSGDIANVESESNGNAAETAAADSETLVDTEVIQENDTSVIISMDHTYAVQLSVSDVRMANSYNDFKSLKLPSQITRQGDYYFIVDTYNDQVLYVSDMWRPISEWRVMDRKFNRPHAIASDGEVYLVVDTDNDRVLCYEYVNGRFQNTQRFDDVGTRPHYIQYDAITESFFVWSSLTGDMYIMKREPASNRMYIEEIRHIYELDSFYVRSFSIEGDEILFPSGNNGYIIVADKDTLHVKNRYPVPMEISGMAFAKKIGNDYYITVSTDDKLNHDKARMIRTSDLESLSLGLYENITGYFKDMRIPYYIDRINGSYCVTNHESKKFVYMFNVSGDVIKDVQTIH